jgi:NADH:ubiquinone oxidoreductase subunit E
MYGPEFDKKVDELVARYPEPKAALLPVLWAVQRTAGWSASPPRSGWRRGWV